MINSTNAKIHSNIFKSILPDINSFIGLSGKKKYPYVVWKQSFVFISTAEKCSEQIESIFINKLIRY